MTSALSADIWRKQDQDQCNSLVCPLDISIVFVQSIDELGAQTGRPEASKRIRLPFSLLTALECNLQNSKNNTPHLIGA